MIYLIETHCVLLFLAAKVCYIFNKHFKKYMCTACQNVQSSSLNDKTVLCV